jgi:hypothetical protein
MFRATILHLENYSLCLYILLIMFLYEFQQPCFGTCPPIEYLSSPGDILKSFNANEIDLVLDERGSDCSAVPRLTLLIYEKMGLQ